MSKNVKQSANVNKKSLAIAIAEIENRVRNAGCKDDCDNCKLEFCARESGVCAIIGDMGDVSFFNGTL